MRIEHRFPHDGVKNAYEPPLTFEGSSITKHPEFTYLTPSPNEEEVVVEVPEADQRALAWARSLNEKPEQRDRIRRMLRHLPRDAQSDDEDRAKKRRLAQQGIIVLGRM